MFNTFRDTQGISEFKNSVMEKTRMNQSTLEGERAEGSLAKEMQKAHDEMGKTDYLSASLKAAGHSPKKSPKNFLSIHT